MRLLPRDEKFFDDFLNQVKLIQEAAGILKAAVHEGNSRIQDAAMRIRTLEEKGDELAHSIFTRLNATFITPLDPEDIQALASRLDDVLDGIEEVAHCLAAYRVEPIPDPVGQMTGSLALCGEALQRAFAALAENKQLMEHCIEINRLENMADEMYRKAMSDLFQNEKDAIQVIKLKEIYDTLERSVDCCEDVTDVLQGVVVKNS